MVFVKKQNNNNIFLLAHIRSPLSWSSLISKFSMKAEIKQKGASKFFKHLIHPIAVDAKTTRPANTTKT